VIHLEVIMSRKTQGDRRRGKIGAFLEEGIRSRKVQEDRMWRPIEEALENETWQDNDAFSESYRMQKALDDIGLEERTTEEIARYEDSLQPKGSISVSQTRETLKDRSRGKRIKQQTGGDYRSHKEPKSTRLTQGIQEGTYTIKVEERANKDYRPIPNQLHALYKLMRALNNRANYPKVMELIGDVKKYHAPVFPKNMQLLTHAQIAAENNIAVRVNVLYSGTVRRGDSSYRVPKGYELKVVS